MDHSLHNQALRLVGEGASLTSAQREARRAVERENRLAASLDEDDARRIFALRVAEALDGGRAAVLPPERRRRLVDAAQRMGIRAFDANLVIAIVQDGARRGRDISGDVTAQRLKLVPAARTERASTGVAGLIIAAGAIALGVVLALIAWITQR